ncbi:MAG: DNA mismatch repair protein MutS [Meiothermus sp.]|jgi:DNA mismatch repair ATPase MutS|nr:DNA mismatch repair protein MutS [Meiothermus sp.]
MKAFLLYPDRDLEPLPEWPEGQAALEQDLQLPVLWNAMAEGDPFVYEVVRKVMLAGLSGDPETIRYRQAVLQDCLANPEALRQLYAITLEAMEIEKKARNWYPSRYPGSILGQSLEALRLYLEVLSKLRKQVEEVSSHFQSEGFRRLFGELRSELSEAYFHTVQEHLKTLRFPQGVLISAGLGKGLKGQGYVLRRPNPDQRGWLERLLKQDRSPSFTFQIHPRDESGAQALSELRDRGINAVANALAQSVDHILGFFALLRTELAFYLGCLRLHKQLVQMGEPVCFPTQMEYPGHAFRGLYDLSLALRMGQKVVGNDLEAPGKALVIITGANQGGKTTFLRSIGQAQLMMQAGMFVGAEQFRSSLCSGLFTHFKREEDSSMQSGKFDEELNRMSQIIEHLSPRALLLFNESFAATNEREGAEIARQIVQALLEQGIRVFFVTHMYALAGGLYQQGSPDAIFLRAQRLSSGQRSFRIIPGPPLPSSFGIDLFQRIFHEAQPLLSSGQGSRAD